MSKNHAWPAEYKMSQTPALGKDDKYRYVLQKIQSQGGRTLIAIGMNPSAANVEFDDPTLANLDEIALHNKYDNWVMLNVFALRESNSDNLSGGREKVYKHFQDKYGKSAGELLLKDARGGNKDEIARVLDKYPEADILVGWGGKSGYLKELADKTLEQLEGRNLLCVSVNGDDSPTHFGPRTLNEIKHARRKSGEDELALVPYVSSLRSILPAANEMGQHTIKYSKRTTA